MIRINLLPVRAAQKKAKLRSQVFIFLLCLILVGAGCGALYVQQMFAADNVRDEIAQLEKKNKILKKKIGKVRDFEKKKADLGKKLDILEKLKAGKKGPVYLLDELSHALPDKVWLTSFTEKGGRINLAGFGVDEHIVANFMENLESSKYYRNVELSVTEQAKVGGKKIQKFTLKCRTETPSSK